MFESVRTGKMQRAEIIALLIERDGLVCAYPGCDEILSLDGLGKKELTLDHHYPQSWCYANGWTTDEVWDLSNLRLMSKACNAKKSDLLPNADGSLPEKPVTQRERRADKSNRPEVCNVCNSGRSLGPDELCGTCGSGPMPHAFPQFAKVKSTECDHQIFWCWACSIGYVQRIPAWETVLDAGFLDE